MAPANATPQSSKKRAIGDTQAVNSFVSLLGRDHEADCQYIDREFRSEPPALAAHIASLIRDKVLHKAVAKAAADQAEASLGRKLPAKCLRYRALPLQTKQEFLDKHTKEPLIYRTADEERKLTSEECDQLIEFGLNISSWNFLPVGHKSDRYTGPLFHIMGMRMQDCGPSEAMAL